MICLRTTAVQNSLDLAALEAEAANIRAELSAFLYSASSAHLSLVSFGRRLGRLEERIERALAASPAAYDRHEGDLQS